MKLTLASTAFTAGRPIPRKYTGDGQDVSPSMAWSNLPDGTKELALIVDDPDAPTKPWVHWVIYRVPADAGALTEGIAAAAEVSAPAGALQGRNSWKTLGYRGPAPPPGRPHHYHFKLYALDTQLNLKAGADKEVLLAAMAGHILAEGELVGTYQRSPMRLYLVQHGQAEPKDVNPDRPLTPQGAADVRNLAAFLRPLRLPAAAVWHSGKTRAAQTAEALAPALAGAPQILQREGLAPNDPPEAIIAELTAPGQDLVIVGHLPSLSRIASVLLAGRESPAVVALEPGTLVCLQSGQGGGWALQWMLPPQLLSDTP